MANLLAIETSTRRPSVAVAAGEAVEQVTAPEGTTTAAWLFPAIKQLLVRHNLKAQHLDTIAVTDGPGSFTGLRIAVTAAKILAYSAQTEVVALNSLSVVAAQSGRQNVPVVSLMDAQRQELFVATVTLDKESCPQHVTETSIEGRDRIAELPAGSILTGPGLEKLSIPNNLISVDARHWFPAAGTLASLASTSFGRQHLADLWTLKPRYVRSSYARDPRPDHG